MSGHSKWATIKRQKGANDAKKGQLFTKLSQAITIAVREAGGVSDPESNYKLRLAIEKARGANMPRESIERAIDKGKGSGAGDLFEAMYEGFGPGGVALLIQAVSDNKQRTVSEVKNVIERNAGSMGGSGSVSYLFEHMGELGVKKNGKTLDEILDIALEAGAQDVEEEEDSFVLYTAPQDLISVKKHLEEKGAVINNAELVYKPKNLVPVNAGLQEKVLSLLEKIEDLPDVQKVYSNANFITS